MPMSFHALFVVALGRVGVDPKLFLVGVGPLAAVVDG